MSAGQMMPVRPGPPDDGGIRRGTLAMGVAHGAGRSAGPVRQGMLLSGAIHVAALAALFLWSTRAREERPPVYRVELVGAPPGPRQVGVVKTDDKPAATPAPDVSGAERVAPVERVPTPVKRAAPTPAQATPSPTRSKAGGAKSAQPTTTAAPKAGAGSQGGKGADVANVRIQGIDFPYPGYLSNITRQIALNWRPRRTSAALVSEVRFSIRRDGTVVGIEVLRSSGDALYNAEAMGAIEAVGATRGFGPLPSGFSDDVLIVYFTFDYALRP